MNQQRRLFLKGLALVTSVLALPKLLLAARPDAAFEKKSQENVMQELFGEAGEESTAINLKVPEIAENGAVVPVTVSTDLENVESISVVVDKNPTPLTAVFNMSPEIEAEVATRIKMGESSTVRAIVKADGKVYYAMKDVKVTIGGCGG